MTYIVIDAANLFFRAKRVTNGTMDEKIGMAMHIVFNSVNNMWRDFSGSMLFFVSEGSSWRKNFYPPYKANRIKKRAERTPAEIEEDKMFDAAFEEFREFLVKHTNVTVLQATGCEGDDFIARWIQTHPDSKHIIIGNDSDFKQLISKNVSQYNGVTNQLATTNGIFDERGKPVIDKKTRVQKMIGDPEWLLFEKCIRGDSADNIFSAYPGARKKGTKNRVGLIDAFNDRNNCGFNWNNFMLQRWTDHEGNEKIVRDVYKRNQTLIDLSRQPDEIKQILDEKIIQEVQKPRKSQIGVKFMRFCGKYKLVRAGDAAQEHVKYLGAGYA